MIPSKGVLSNRFRGEPIRGTEVEVSGQGKLKNGKAAGKEEVTGKMIKVVGEIDDGGLDFEISLFFSFLFRFVFTSTVSISWHDASRPHGDGIW